MKSAIENNTKTCNCCHVEKDLSEFYKQSRNTDGHGGMCKTCVRVNARVSRARRDNNRPFLTTWRRIMASCHNMVHWDSFNSESCQKTWRIYGGRGIEVSGEFHDYYTFRDFIVPLHADAVNRYGSSVELFLDRIDVNGNYERGNLRFVSAIESAMNRRESLTEEATHLGITQPIVWWARIYQMDHATVLNRMARGWSIERALNEPAAERFSVMHTNKKAVIDIDIDIECIEGCYYLNGVEVTFAELCRTYGLNPSTANARIRSGWDMKAVFGTSPNVTKKK